MEIAPGRSSGAGDAAGGGPAAGQYRAADPLSVLRHRWWLVALLTALGLAGAGGWLQAGDPVWESTTSVLVHPVAQDTNVVGGRTQGQVNLDTEAQLVGSTAVTAGAAERLGLDPVPADLGQRVSVEVPPNTSVLAITFAAGTPAGARAGAQAFAEAYLQHRAHTARADLAARMTAIEGKLDELDGTLTGLNRRLAGTPLGTPAAANLESRRDTVTSQVQALTDRLNGLATATVTAGAVIREPRLPEHPSRPRPALVLASGAALGLAAGFGAAGLAERLARRVRRPADLPRRLGIPVLVAFSRAAAPPADEIASPYGPTGRTVDRLRNEVIASDRVAPGGPVNQAATGRVVVVTSPTGGTAAGLVAANLAASLSRSGHDVVLVGAGTPGKVGPLTRLLGIAATPGLSEVLAGRAGVADALQPPPRHPRLRAMTMGGTATATGLLQSPALRTVLATLAAQAGYVVVAAPATATSADAQSLASHADLALLAVEARRTRLADTGDAAVQLRQVGTPLLGAVVLPLRRQEPETEELEEYGLAVPDGPDEASPRHAARPRPSTPPAAIEQPTLVMARLADQPGPRSSDGEDPAEPGGPDGGHDPEPARTGGGG